jgi:hypothetical protein
MQFGRNMHGGALVTTDGTNCTRRVTRLQRPSPKCRQPCEAQGADMRNTSLGSTGAAVAAISGVSGTSRSRYAARGSVAVPWMTANTATPSALGWALGHSDAPSCRKGCIRGLGSTNGAPSPPDDAPHWLTTRSMGGSLSLSSTGMPSGKQPCRMFPDIPVPACCRR